MKNAAILLSLTLASMTAAQTPPAAPIAKPTAAAKAPESDVPACMTPTPRGDDGAKARQDEVLRRVREAKAPVNVVFVGDSITQGWEDAGAAAWKRNFEPMGALQIGVGGDRTEHVLWRLQQAPLTPLDPKVIVLMIGTNNAGTGRDSGELIIRGIAAIVDLLHMQCPNAQVLVLDIPPRGLPINPLRGVVLQVNQALSQRAWGDHARFVRVADRFVLPDGRIDQAAMPDHLHFSPAGYDAWAEGIAPAVTSAMPKAKPAAQEPSAPQAPAPPADPPAASRTPRTGT